MTAPAIDETKENSDLQTDYLDHRVWTLLKFTTKWQFSMVISERNAVRVLNYKFKIVTLLFLHYIILLFPFSSFIIPHSNTVSVFLRGSASDI